MPILTSSARARILLAVAVLGSASLLTGCSAVSGLFPAQAERDTDTNEVVESGQADAFSLVAGDCFDEQDADEITEVPAVPCAEPHDYEVYTAFDMSGDEYPGDDAVATAADEGCYDAFPAFVGMSYEESVLDYSYLTPTSSSWDQGDREIVCLAFEGMGKVTGSLANAGR